MAWKGPHLFILSQERTWNSADTVFLISNLDSICVGDKYTKKEDINLNLLQKHWITTRL